MAQIHTVLIVMLTMVTMVTMPTMVIVFDFDKFLKKNLVCVIVFYKNKGKTPLNLFSHQPFSYKLIYPCSKEHS